MGGARERMECREVLTDWLVAARIVDDQGSLCTLTVTELADLFASSHRTPEECGCSCTSLVETATWSYVEDRRKQPPLRKLLRARGDNPALIIFQNSGRDRLFRPRPPAIDGRRRGDAVLQDGTPKIVSSPPRAQSLVLLRLLIARASTQPHMHINACTCVCRVAASLRL